MIGDTDYRHYDDYSTTSDWYDEDPWSTYINIDYWERTTCVDPDVFTMLLLHMFRKNIIRMHWKIIDIYKCPIIPKDPRMKRFRKYNQKIFLKRNNLELILLLVFILQII